MEEESEAQRDELSQDLKWQCWDLNPMFYSQSHPLTTKSHCCSVKGTVSYRRIREEGLLISKGGNARGRRKLGFGGSTLKKRI